MHDIPKVVVAVVLFVVILLTFVFTIQVMAKTRYLTPPPETVYLDLGTQKVRASISIVARPETPQPQVPPDG